MSANGAPTDGTTWEALLDLGGPGHPGVRLSAALRAAIADGRLAAGTRLPSTRDLAADLRLSRGVVVRAYEQLAAEGRLLARHGAGTVVAATGGPDEPAPAPPPGALGVAPLRPGVPDLGMFPRTAWRRAYEQALAELVDADLDYGDPAGARRAREELAAYLGRVRAARASAATTILTTGATQAVALLADALKRRGIHEIGMEDPGSAAIRDHLAAHGVRPVPVAVDGAGLDVGAMPERLRAVFVTPAHQYPTGVVLAPERRAALIAHARRCHGLIVEDDYDAEFRYGSEPVGCVQGLAPDVVALLGSVSKALAPALRLGWLVAPPRWADELRAAKFRADQSGPALDHLAFAAFLAAGAYDRHLRAVRRVQRRRREAVADAVRRWLPGAAVRGIAAGLHLLIELPAGVDDDLVVARARDAGLAPVALSALRCGDGPPGLVLGYAAHSPDQLTDAVRRLARCLVP